MIAPGSSTVSEKGSHCTVTATATVNTASDCHFRQCFIKVEKSSFLSKKGRKVAMNFQKIIVLMFSLFLVLEKGRNIIFLAFFAEKISHKSKKAKI